MSEKRTQNKPVVAKPINVARMECLQQIVETLNKNQLPAFVKVELLERILNELRPQIDAEYRNDLVLYKKATGGIDNDD